MHDHLIADAMAHERALQQILLRRPDLSVEVLKDEIRRLAEKGTHSASDWTEHCLERARRFEPLPWEDAALRPDA